MLLTARMVLAAVRLRCPLHNAACVSIAFKPQHAHIAHAADTAIAVPVPVFACSLQQLLMRLHSCRSG
jgi:hypothetical protein